MVFAPDKEDLTVRPTMIIFLACAQISTIVCACGSTTSMRPWGPLDELEYADAIVVGMIRDLNGIDVPVQEFMPGDPREDVLFPVTLLTLTVTEVIGGDLNQGTLEAVVPGGRPRAPVGLSGFSYDYNVGEEVLLALTYSKYMRGGAYLVSGDLGSFVRRGGVWQNRGDENETVDKQTVREIVQRASPAAISREADVVISGVVSSVVREKSGDVVVDRVSFAQPTMLLGSAPRTEEVLIVRTIADKRWRPCPVISAGEQWIFFLSRSGDLIWPHWGSNGTFLVDGNKIVKNGRTLSLSKSDLLEIIDLEGGTR